MAFAASALTKHVIDGAHGLRILHAKVPVGIDPKPVESVLGFTLRLASANDYTFLTVPVARLLKHGHPERAITEIVSPTGAGPSKVRAMLRNAPQQKKTYVPRHTTRS